MPAERGSATIPFLSALLLHKKQQASLLFATWDTEDDGLLSVSHLAPILETLFPASQQHKVVVAQLLAASRVRHLFTAVTGRPWYDMRRQQLSVMSLSDLHRIMELLCKDDEEEEPCPEPRRPPVAHGVGPDTRGNLYDVSPAAVTEAQFFGEEASSSRRDSVESSPPVVGAPTIKSTRYLLMSGTLERVFNELAEAAGVVKGGGAAGVNDIPLDQLTLHHMCEGVLDVPLSTATMRSLRASLMASGSASLSRNLFSSLLLSLAVPAV